MAEILVLVEHVDGAVKKVTLELLTLARSLGEPSAVFVGNGADAALATLAENGAATVYVADAADVSAHPVAPKAEVLAQLVAEKSPAAVLIPSAAEGREVAGRLAVKINSGVTTGAVGIDADLTATQSIFGGGVIVKSKVSQGTPIITVRPNSSPVEAAAAAGARVDVAVELSEAAKKATTTDKVEESKGARPELTEAAIVVSGGRGVGRFARRCRWRLPRSHGRRVVPAPVPGGADRKDGLAAAVHR